MLHPRRTLLLLLTSFTLGSHVSAAALPQADQEPIRLRVLTYNIHHGEGTDGVFDLERIAAVIKSVEPDLVALQEVDRNTGRSGGVDQAAELARLTGLEFYFGKAMDYDGGEYGEAILTRFSFEWSRTYPLSAEEDKEPRAMAVVVVDLPDGNRLGFVGTHLDHTRDPTSRLMQVSEINELFSNRARGAPPFILAGDLNATVDREEMQILLEIWGDAATEKPEPTIPVVEPSRRIDYVLYTPWYRFQVVETRVLDEQVASDHRPVLAVLDILPVDVSRGGAPPDMEHIRYFRIRSDLLSEFWGRDIFIEAGVVLPPDRRSGEKPSLCIDIHGFGGDHHQAWRAGRELVEAMTDEGYPRMIYVYPNANVPMGHHVFANSVNNGPWGEAFITEFIPALEREFEAWGTPEGRLLTGHSSGGWSSLWLQVNYPDFFGGTWSVAPDPVDFRHFSGVNIYEFENAFVDPEGNETMLIRMSGQFVLSFREYTRRELEEREYGGVMSSFNAVFSPRSEDGRPMWLFDPTTGEIDRSVARAWEKYDISLILRRNWVDLGLRVRGKIRVYCGTEDNYQLEGAIQLLKQELGKLGSDAEIVLVQERDHMTLLEPHPELWPDGLLVRIHHEMIQVFQRSTTIGRLRVRRMPASQSEAPKEPRIANQLQLVSNPRGRSRGSRTSFSW